MMSALVPIKEVNGAGERSLGSEPVFGQNSQTAGDTVKLSVSAGGAVRMHAITDSSPIDEPGHVDVIRVEPGGHAHQGLLPDAPLVIFSLFFSWSALLL